MANSTGRPGTHAPQPAPPVILPPPGPPPGNHGRTSAAWVTVALISLGSLVASVAMIFGSLPLTLAGVAVIVAGLVVGRVMRAMGLGQHGTTQTSTHG